MPENYIYLIICNRKFECIDLSLIHRNLKVNVTDRTPQEFDLSTLRNVLNE